jgi:hypothetical protein
MLQEIERLLAESEIMEVGGDTENAMHRLHRKQLKKRAACTIVSS